jgi:hypothetical protein
MFDFGKILPWQIWYTVSDKNKKGGQPMTDKQRAWLIAKAAMKWVLIIAGAIVFIPAAF